MNSTLQIVLMGFLSLVYTKFITRSFMLINTLSNPFLKLSSSQQYVKSFLLAETTAGP
jgi:hypothetical protein